jgi:integrase
MRTTKPRVTKYKGSSSSKFVVEGLRVEGKRTRKFFRTRREAEAWLRKTVARVKKEGEGAIHMPEDLRVEAMKCAEQLRPHGRSLTEAVRHFLSHLHALERSCDVQALIAQFRASKEQDGVSERYLKDLKNRLLKFEEAFGKEIVADIEASAIDDWLRSLKVGAQTRNNFRTVLRTMFEFAVMRGFASNNPVANLAKAKVVRAAPAIFSPDEMRRLLDSASREFLPYLAIGGFAGLRAAEIERLDWSEVDLSQRLIHVKAEKSKTAQRRLTTISDNLSKWLAPLAKKSGPVAENVRVERDKACVQAGVEWKANALRHSFASYHLAHFKNVAETASELGHSSSAMLFQHYRELVKPSQASEWWEITPKVTFGDVVLFKAGQ